MSKTIEERIAPFNESIRKFENEINELQEQIEWKRLFLFNTLIHKFYIQNNIPFYIYSEIDNVLCESLRKITSIMIIDLGNYCFEKYTKKDNTEEDAKMWENISNYIIEIAKEWYPDKFWS